jgi:hypothetical protein
MRRFLIHLVELYLHYFSSVFLHIPLKLRHDILPPYFGTLLSDEKYSFLAFGCLGILILQTVLTLENLKWWVCLSPFVAPPPLRFLLFSVWFFYRPSFSPFLFALVLSICFSAHVVSSLAYPNLLRTKMLDSCCCGSVLINSRIVVTNAYLFWMAYIMVLVDFSYFRNTTQSPD